MRNIRKNSTGLQKALKLLRLKLEILKLLIYINIYISGDTLFLQNLKLKMRKSQMWAFNKGMFNCYIRHCKAYMEFCQLFDWDCFLLDAEKSALFVTYLDNGERNAEMQSSVRSVA